MQESQQAGILGFPIFCGVTVGSEGLAFRCYTVNVKNDADEAFLDVLESDAFKQGLELTGTFQPVIKPFAEMAYGLPRTLAKRHRNVPVQDVYMGLDFTGVPGRARLAEGAYLAVQIPNTLTVGEVGYGAHSVPPEECPAVTLSASASARGQHAGLLAF